MTPEIVATAQRIHAEAQASHLAAAEKASAIQSRIASAQLRLSEITAARINGTSSQAETAEYAALHGDVELLQKMLVEAQGAAAGLLANQQAAQEKLQSALRAYEMDQTRVEFGVLSEKAEALEQALCACIQQLHQRGQALGRGPSVCMYWKPSAMLANAVRGTTL